MPTKKTTRKAKRALRRGQRPSTAAGEFVREEIEHVRQGKHGARSTRQAIAIGLSKARRAGVPLSPPRRGTTSERTRRAAQRDVAAGRKRRKVSRRRSAATQRALGREPRAAGSHRALSAQTRRAQARRSAPQRSKSARAGAATRKRTTAKRVVARGRTSRRSVSSRGATTRGRGTRRRTTGGRKRATRSTASGARRYWSAEVTRRSDALDLEPGVFQRSPSQIARSLQRSAEKSQRRHSSPFRSAMSMLTFYENRAGSKLSAARRRVLERAKQELRKLYGR